MWLIATVFVVVWLIVVFYLGVKAVDKESAPLGILCAFICIGPLMFLISKEEEKGPCVAYETQLHYNAATKTMMPAKVCVNRGEWVDGE